jgi:CRISPR-associated exonuclease Cas4
MKVTCPDKSEKEIDECLNCENPCYPKFILKLLLDGRKKKKKKRDRQRFGVTRLVGGCLRKTYYDLTEEVSRTLEKMWIFNRGTAIHEFVQKDMPEEDVELFLTKEFGHFDVLAFVDAIHEGVLYEFKTTANIPQEPQEHHTLQAQAYYSILPPEKQEKIKKLVLMYFSLHKIKQFEVPKRDITHYLEARGTMLANALTTGTEPKREEGWLCDYCEFKDICYGHKLTTYIPEKKEEDSQTKLDT